MFLYVDETGVLVCCEGANNFEERGICFPCVEYDAEVIREDGEFYPDWN